MMREEEQETPTERYVKDFNRGYMIAMFMPELANDIKGSLNNAGIGKAFGDGQEQFLREQAKEKAPSWVKGNRSAPTPDKEIPGKDYMDRG